MNDEREQQREHDEEREDRRDETRTVAARGRAVINREQRRDQRPIRLIARERAEGCRVAEEERNVPQLANSRVVFDRVRVVEVEAIVKMVCVGREEDDEQQRAAETCKEFFAHRVRLGFRHRTSLPQQTAWTQSRCCRGSRRWACAATKSKTQARDSGALRRDHSVGCRVAGIQPRIEHATRLAVTLL